jgi:uncharacterized protein (TIGR03437 family)
MRTHTVLSLLLFSAMIASVASADSGFLLGLDYSQWLVPNVAKLATDSSGAIYILSNAGASGQNTPPSTVTKLSADGKTIVWQNRLGISVSTMAVDPNGGVYVSPINSNALSSALNPGVLVAKLNDGGSGIAWTKSTGLTFPNGALPTAAADLGGRVYVGGLGTGIVRIAANGASIDYTSPLLVGLVSSIAVDASGAAFVAGGWIADGFIARYAPDGTPGFYTLIPDSQVNPTVVLDPSGNPVVYSRGILSRFDASGTMTSWKRIIPGVNASSPLAMDQAGNAYLMGDALGIPGSRLGPQLANLPVKNTLAACGTEFLQVLAPDGSVLQTTYLPGGLYNTAPLIAIGRNGTVLIAAGQAPSFAPTRTGPFPAGEPSATNFLLSLSPTALSGTATADTFPLACIGNGGGYQIQSISPGQLLTLFGNGLGPQQGVEPQATLQTAYPVRAGNVEVTFDGTPAPILWAQDGQVNVAAPWSLNTGKNTQVCASYNSVKLKCLSWPTTQMAPGVFTLDDGTDPVPPTTLGNARYAIALNQDGSVNSAANPAEAGSLVSVFATGLGPISPAQFDGSLINFPLPGNAISPTVEGIIFLGFHTGGPYNYVPTEVTYAGPAPYRVAGISQINFRLLTRAIPNSYQVKLPTGTSQPFLIHVR